MAMFRQLRNSGGGAHANEAFPKHIVYPSGMFSISSFARFLLAIIIAFVFFGVVSAQDLNPLLTSLRKQRTNCARRATIVTLYLMDKRAIPDLIAHIGDADLIPSSTLMLADPLLSYAPPGSQRNEFSGVLYAYVVELILARDTFNGNEGHCEFLLNEGDYVYGHGVIMKSDTVIEANDLERVKHIYSEWWQANKMKSLTELRHDWKAGVRPLSGSGYKWY